MITAELGTAYPDQGGIYSWVRRAYGERWASRTTYWYYVNVALWMPAVFLLFTGIFCQLFVSKWADWAEQPIDAQLISEVEAILAPVMNQGHVEGRVENN